MQDAFHSIRHLLLMTHSLVSSRQRTSARSNRRTIAATVALICLWALPQAGIAAQKSPGDSPREWTFRNHVLPVLAKVGCNSGACHGALSGKGGFRLSLRGYDPIADYHQITRDARGRRLELADPGRSLLLAKPSGAVRHKGGRLLPPGSRNYQVIAEWIANGAPPPTPDDPVLNTLEVSPEVAVLSPGDIHQLTVTARYSDGSVEDVTPWVKLTSANETVAKVDDDTGVITVVGHGEGAITVWFSSKIVLAHITVPFPNDIPNAVFANAPRRNFIDELVLEQLQRLQLQPSPRADDSAFLRRAYLTTIGLMPRPDEVRAFIDDPSPSKRDRVTETLLARPEFVDYWTYKISDILLISGHLLRPYAVKAYYQWLRETIRQDTPWDDLVRQVVTAKGESLENGATNFYAVHQDPETMAENVSQAFLSLSINCARCHNHPLEKWTNDQYYGFANLFSRVRAKGWGGEPRSGDGLRTLYVEPQGELIQPKNGKPQPPAPLDAEPIGFDIPGDRREPLADWLTSPENPYFSRAIANRVWANFFGVGLVEPIDDLRISNPPSNGKLLEALAEHVAAQDFDLKALMRTILQSETFQRSSEVLPENANDFRFFSRFYPTRLMAEVLHDAIAQVTDVPADFTTIAFPGGDRQTTDFYPKGTRAIQLFDSAVESYFLETFGRNERAITCECERSNEPSMVQVLHLSNGDAINERLSQTNSCAAHLSRPSLSDAERIEQAYLLCLARYPTENETTQFAEILASAEPHEKREVVEDIFWALMSSREFLFIH